LAFQCAPLLGQQCLSQMLHAAVRTWMVVKRVTGLMLCWNPAFSMWCRAWRQTVVCRHTPPPPQQQQQQPGLRKAGSKRRLLLPSRALQQQ
jgi:hypothetical protein